MTSGFGLTSSGRPGRGARVFMVACDPNADVSDAIPLFEGLRGAGYKVVAAAMHQSPEQVIDTIMARGATSLLLWGFAGGHEARLDEVIRLLDEAELDHVQLLVVGNVPEAARRDLLGAGVDQVFTHVAPIQDVIDAIDDHTWADRATGMYT